MFRGVDYFMIVGGLEAENLAQYFVVDGVEFLEHAICKYKRFSGIKKDRLDDLSVNSEAPLTRKCLVFKEWREELACPEGFGGALARIRRGVCGVGEVYA